MKKLAKERINTKVDRQVTDVKYMDLRVFQRRNDLKAGCSSYQGTAAGDELL